MRLATGLCILVSVLLSSATSAPGAEGPQVESCLDRPHPTRSSEQTVAIRTVEGDRLETIIVARLVWKHLADGRYAGLVRLLAPPEVARMGVLVREDAPGGLVEKGPRAGEVYLYLPELRRVRRVSARQATASLFGTAFSYEDFDRVSGQVRASRVEKHGVVQESGRRAYRLEVLPPAEGDSPYSRIESWIDVVTCLPLRIDYHDGSGELTKRLVIDPSAFERVEGIWIARSVSMVDLQEGVESVLEVEKISFDRDLPDGAFTPASLAEDF